MLFLHFFLSCTELCRYVFFKNKYNYTAIENDTDYFKITFFFF